MMRPAEAADLPALMAIWNPLIRDTLVTFTTDQKSLPDMEKMLSEKSALALPFLVAERQGTVAGFATYGAFRPGPGYRFTAEHSIILGEAAHGCGIGRALLTQLERHAHIHGIHSMIAGVSSGNAQGRAFHLAMGYAETTILPEVGHKFGRWWDLVLMQKFLT